MAKTKKGNRATNKAKKVAPIKVEKIVDEPSSSKREVVAIIIGILVVAALVVGSVIYFKGDKDPLTQKSDKKDNVVDVEDDVLDLLEEEKEENEKNSEQKYSYVKQVSNTVKKECTTCTVVTLEPYKATVNKNHENYTENMEDEVLVGSKNETKTTVYYTDEENTYQIVVEGTVKATEDEIVNMVVSTMSSAVNKITEDKKMNDQQKEEFKEELGFSEIEDEMEEVGLIVVTSEDTAFATHGIAVRIEVEDKVDWSKGVTVNGTTYNESVLNKENKNTHTLQDEDGINIILGVTEEDMGEDATNAPIEFDVKYTTQKGDEKEEKYEVDLTEAVIEYEKEEDYEEEGRAATEEEVKELEEMLDTATENLEEMADIFMEEGTLPEPLSESTEEA